MGFVGPRGIHGGLGGGALEGRRFFKRGLDVGRDGDDVVRADEGDQRVELAVEGVEKLVGRGVDGGEFGEDFLRGFGGVDVLGDAGELGLVLVQVGVGDLEQAVERDVDHFVVEKLFGKVSAPSW